MTRLRGDAASARPARQDAISARPRRDWGTKEPPADNYVFVRPPWDPNDPTIAAEIVMLVGDAVHVAPVARAQLKKWLCQLVLALPDAGLSDGVSRETAPVKPERLRRRRLHLRGIDGYEARS